MKKTRFLALLAVARALFATAEPAPFAYVEVESFQALQSNATALGIALGNPMLATGVVGVGHLLGSPGMLGIDQTKPIRLVFASEHDVLNAQPVVIVPLSDADGSAYLKSLAAVAKETVPAAAGFSTYTFNRSQVPYRFRIAGGYALFTSEDSVPDAFLNTLATELEANPQAYTLPDIPGTLRARLSTSFVLPTLKKILRDAVEGLDDPDRRNQANSASQELIHLLGTVDSFAFSLSADLTHGLTIVEQITFGEDSSLSKTFTLDNIFTKEHLQYLDPTAEFFLADLVSGPLARNHKALVQAYPTLLSLVPGFQPNADWDTFFDNWKQQAQTLPDAFFTSLRYDDQGRPNLYIVGTGGDPDTFLQLYHTYAQTKGINATQRTVQDTTILSVAALSDFPGRASKYLEQHQYRHEMFSREVRQTKCFYAVSGPTGILDDYITNPPQNNRPPQSFDLFDDILDRNPAFAMGSLDLASIIRKIALWYNSTEPDPEKQVGPDVLAKFSPQSIGRVGFILWTPKPKPTTTLNTTIRLSPDLLKHIPAISQVIQDISFPGLMRPPAPPAPLPDPSDEDLDALLKEADQILE